MLKRPHLNKFSQKTQSKSSNQQTSISKISAISSNPPNLTPKNETDFRNLLKTGTTPKSSLMRLQYKQYKNAEESSKENSFENEDNSIKNMEILIENQREPSGSPSRSKKNKASFSEFKTTDTNNQKTISDVLLEIKNKQQKPNYSRRSSYSSKKELTMPISIKFNAATNNNNSAPLLYKRRNSLKTENFKGFKMNLQQLQMEKKDDSTRKVITETIENSEKSEENLDRKKQKYKEIRKWTEISYKRKDSIRLSPKLSNLSPKFSHQMFVKNPIKKIPKLNLNPDTFRSHSNQRNVSPNFDSNRGFQTDRNLTQRSKKPAFEPFLTPSKDFFIELLKKLENFDFTISMGRILNAEVKEYQIELAKDLYETEYIEQNFKEFVQKCGNEFFQMVKEIYSMYKSQTAGLNNRDLLNLIKDFEILNKIQLKMCDIEVCFSKYAKKKNLMLKGLIELFYHLHKFQKFQKNKDFRLFFKEVIHPKYNEYRLKLAELNIEKIYIFNKSQSHVDENMIFQMLVDFKNVLAHFFYLFSTNDIKILEERFLDEKNLIKFCKIYNIIPAICNSPQVINIFRNLRIRGQEIINYEGFVLFLCCVAHIGFKNKNFFEKLWRLFDHLLIKNNLISDRLILEKYYNI